MIYLSFAISTSSKGENEPSSLLYKKKSESPLLFSVRYIALIPLASCVITVYLDPSNVISPFLNPSGINSSENSLPTTYFLPFTFTTGPSAAVVFESSLWSSVSSLISDGSPAPIVTAELPCVISSVLPSVAVPVALDTSIFEVPSFKAWNFKLNSAVVPVPVHEILMVPSFAVALSPLINFNSLLSYVNVASIDCSDDTEDNFVLTSTSAPTVVDGSAKRNSAVAASVITDKPGHIRQIAKNVTTNFFIFLM